MPLECPWDFWRVPRAHQPAKSLRELQRPRSPPRRASRRRSGRGAETLLPRRSGSRSLRESGPFRGSARACSRRIGAGRRCLSSSSAVESLGEEHTTLSTLKWLKSSVEKLSEKSRMELRWWPYGPPERHFSLRIPPKSTPEASPAPLFGQFRKGFSPKFDPYEKKARNCVGSPDPQRTR
jgi:hypothetical protein